MEGTNWEQVSSPVGTTVRRRGSQSAGSSSEMRGVQWVSVLVALVLTGCGSTTTVTQTATVTNSTTSPTTQSTTAAQSATATQAAPYSGVAPNANYGPATDQSACSGTQVTVGPDTSCPFAANVAKVVSAGDHATGHFPASVTAFSPVTGKTYRLRCSILGYGSELVCGTLAPATGIVVIPTNGPIATTPPPPTNSTPESGVEGPGSFSHATDAQFCSTHSCIENFPNGNGSIVQCADGEWSHSGGLSGACSDHGGEG